MMSIFLRLATESLMPKLSRVVAVKVHTKKVWRKGKREDNGQESRICIVEFAVCSRNLRVRNDALDQRDDGLSTSQNSLPNAYMTR